MMMRRRATALLFFLSLCSPGPVFAAEEKCPTCEGRVVVATTINAVRTASLLVPSASRLGIALRVYHENSVDEANGMGGFVASRDVGRCSLATPGCFQAFDLHLLYPWLERFAHRDNDSSVFAKAYNNAQTRAKFSRHHARGLTVKAHFIFRKVLALRHSVLNSKGVELVIWADADVLLRKRFDDPFYAFALSQDVATIHRFETNPMDVTNDKGSCGIDAATYFSPARSLRALPDTGFVTFNVANSSRAIEFVEAWSGYYGTRAAAQSSCLNDICVYDRILAAHERTIHPLKPSRDRNDDGLLDKKQSKGYVPSKEAAEALLPRSLTRQRGDAVTLLEAWIASYIYGGSVPNGPLTRSAELKEGWFALCAEEWRSTPLTPEKRALINGDMMGGGHEEALTSIVVDDSNIMARYRINLGRAHICPGATSNASPFHLFEYALHAKGGSDEEKKAWAVGAAEQQGRRQLREQEEEEQEQGRRQLRKSAPTAIWHEFRKEGLSHPYDVYRVDFDGLLETSLRAKVPLHVTAETYWHLSSVSFAEQLLKWDASIGYATPRDGLLSLPQRERSVLGSLREEPRACAIDPEALELQVELAHRANTPCGCPGESIRYRMEGTIGLGAEFAALLKPFTNAYDRGRRFLDPTLLRVGCEKSNQSMAKCLGLLSASSSDCQDECSDYKSQELVESARKWSRGRNATVPAKYAHRGLFWWTAQVLGFLLRPDDATHTRLRGNMRWLGWKQSDRPTLALHVRRGDTCMDGGSNELKKGKGRSCDSIETYAERARLMIKSRGFRSVYVATDDGDVAAAATSRAMELFGLPASSVFVAPVDRSLYAKGYYNKVLKQAKGKEAQADANSLLDDMFLLAHADGFVGKFTSNVARHAFALSTAIKGGDCIVPFDSLDSTWCADFGEKVGDSIHGKFLC